MKKTILSIAMLAGILVGFTSCEDDYEAPKAKTLPMAGEWWVEIFDEEGELLGSYADIAHALTTYNTSANTETDMWLDDTEGILPVKSRVKVNLGDLSFVPAEPVENLYDESFNIQILEGKIIPGAATTPNGGYKVDSMYLKLSLVGNDPDDPFVETYILSGYKNSGWPEDRWDL